MKKYFLAVFSSTFLCSILTMSQNGYAIGIYKGRCISTSAKLEFRPFGNFEYAKMYHSDFGEIGFGGHRPTNIDLDAGTLRYIGTFNFEFIVREFNTPFPILEVYRYGDLLEKGMCIVE